MKSPSRSTTTRICRRATTTSPRTAGSLQHRTTADSAPTPLYTSASTANLEWLPGKTLGMSSNCGTDAALGDLPLIYPFLVNDPGEGTQAKRRAHATLVDHLIPPMARAESYGDISRLEQLLDEHTPTSPHWTRPSCRPFASRSGR